MASSYQTLCTRVRTMLMFLAHIQPIVLPAYVQRTLYRSWSLWKPCHCVVSCQQLRDFTIAARLRSIEFKWPELLSQHYNYPALMIQLHDKAEVTWCPWSHDAITLGKCQKQKWLCVMPTVNVRVNMLTLHWPWLKSGGHDSHLQPEWAYT